MKTLPYEDLFKVAHTFAAASEVRPILTGVLHREDGSLVATDSHRLIILESAHNRNDNAVIRTGTADPLDGTYPDVERIIPQNTEDFEINVAEWLKIHKEISKEIRKAKIDQDRVVKLKADYDDKEFTMFAKEDETIKSTLPLLSDRHLPERLAYRVKYMIDMLQAVKKFGHKTCSLKFPLHRGNYNRLAPFIVEAERIKGLILPVRAW